MRHLSIRTKLSIIILALILPIAVLAYQLNHELTSGIQFAEQQVKGVTYEKPVLKLMNEIADYQVAALRKAAGDADAAKDMEEGSASIDKLFEELTAIDANVGADLDFTPEGLKAHNQHDITPASLIKKWQEIKATPSKQEPYAALLGELGVVVKHLGDTSKMILDPELDSYYLVDLALAVFPKTLQELVDIKTKTYNALITNHGQLPASLLAEYIGDITMIEKELLPRTLESAHTSLNEDANSNGISPTLKKNLEPALAKYEQGAKELMAAMHELAKGGTMEGVKFLEIADVMHDGTADLGQVALDELQVLIELRKAALKETRLFTLGICGALVLAALLAAYFISEGITRPIGRMSGMLARIAEGDTDMEIKLSTGKDEISLLGNAAAKLRESVEEAYRMKQMVETMPASVMTVDVRDNLKVNYINKSSVDTLTKIEAHLPVKANQILGQSIDIFHKDPSHQRRMLADPKNLPHKARIKVGGESMQLMISAINNKKGDYIGAMLAWTIITAQDKLANDFERDVKGIVNIVAAAATELSQTAQAMTGTISNSAKLAVSASSAAAQTSSNVQSVASAAEELSASVREISGQLQKTTQLVNDSTEKTQNADKLAMALGAATTRVNEVMGMISSIAGQINLLALNATIESARAGDAGKGFAVVASEVKSLAGQTDKSIAEIQTVIEEMRSASEAITLALTDIRGSVTNISSAATTVASAVEEQSATTNEIAKSMQTAAQGTQLITNNLDSVSNASAEAGSSASQMLAASQELSRQAESLSGQVDAFLTKIRAA